MGSVTKFFQRGNLVPAAILSAIGIASPRLTYAAAAMLFGAVLPVDKPPELGAIDFVLLVVGASFAAVFAFDARSCSAALDYVSTVVGVDRVTHSIGLVRRAVDARVAATDRVRVWPCRPRSRLRDVAAGVANRAHVHRRRRGGRG